MPRIFDNIAQELLPALRQTLGLSERSDFCVGYFNLRGWKAIDGMVDKWSGEASHQCRLLVGMQRLPQDELRQAYSLLPQEDQVSNQAVVRLKRRLAKEFQDQLTFGAPTDEDESGLRRLAAQLKAGKVVVKLFLRHPLHAKLYLCFRPDPNSPIVGFLGSSNLTFAGLSQQGELNVDVLDHDAAEKLARWFDDRWNDRWCVDITKDLIQVIEESWARLDALPPFWIYIKMAYHLAEEARAGLSEFSIPADMRGTLLDFQSAAVRIAARHLQKRGGVILGDVVGLGKTLMATALARVFQDPPHSLETLILCPKNLVGMWEDYAENCYENLLIFTDTARTQSLWYWVKRESGKAHPRDHFYVRGQPGDLFISKLAAMVVDISELDTQGNIALAEVAGRLKKALDVERVTKKFYGEFDIQRLEFTELILGIKDEHQRRWYASVLMNRLMFIWFLQKKFFLDNRNVNYLTDKLDFSRKKLGADKFYPVFLNALFFEGFAKPEPARSNDVRALLGKIRYLNGGLFLPHHVELEYGIAGSPGFGVPASAGSASDEVKAQKSPRAVRTSAAKPPEGGTPNGIFIPDRAFENVFTLFGRYSWNLDDAPAGKADEINPDVLGYIFEKYIDQKEFGAYYTRPEMTGYLCERTIFKLVLDRVNKALNRRFHSISDSLLSIDTKICRTLVFEILPALRVLDPACGSGAFLVAAMKVLINIYSAILGKVELEFLGDPDLKKWHDEVHHYDIKYRLGRDTEGEEE